MQLEYDILEYVVIERLAQGGRDKLKDDGLNLSDWLQSLASFWGHLYVYFSSLKPRRLLPSAYPVTHIKFLLLFLSSSCHVFLFFLCLMIDFLASVMCYVFAS